MVLKIYLGLALSKYSKTQGFPGDSVSKESTCNAGDCNARDSSLIPGSGRSPGEGNGNPLQYSCLGNPMDRGGWQATLHGVTKDLDMTDHTHTYHTCYRKPSFQVISPI